MYPLDKFEHSLKSHAKLLEDIQQSEKIHTAWQAAITLLINAYKNGSAKVFFCGNGGSAADAQHIAAELSGRFYKNRKPLYAEALHVNTSYLTAVANDFGYDQVYERAVEAFMSSGDVLVALSTSGNSNNIVRAANKAHDLKAKVIALTGNDGGALGKIGDIHINVPSKDTPRIQEMHIMIGHILCEALEDELFPNA